VAADQVIACISTVSGYAAGTVRRDSPTSC
jgi:hypothetical protein